MSFRAHIPHSDFPDGEDDDADAFLPGERLGPPAVRPGGSTFLSAALVIAVACGGAWVFAQYPAAWQAIVAAGSTLMERTAAAPPPAPPSAPLVAANPEPLPPSPVAPHDVAVAPGADAGVPVAATSPPPAQEPEPNTAEEVDAPVAGEDKPAPLTPPTADPSDPNQKRALAAGLHPDVSRTLLARLTTADYRNARKAVQTALAETDDDAVYAWPPQPAANRAMFEVHFVTGASSACRRYVVTVTLERWSTTAPPMEKCGADLPKRKVAKAAAG